MCKLCHTELKDNFKEEAAMLQISEIVKKTEAMFDLFNNHFYNMKLTRPAITVSPDGGRGAYGWTVTTLNPESEAWIIATLGEADIHASRLQASGSTKGGRKKSINRSIRKNPTPPRRGFGSAFTPFLLATP